MRKLIIIVAAAFICAGLDAKQTLVVSSGSTSCFKEDAEAIFVLDYANATFQHETTLQEESGDAWEERLNLMNEGFISGFNDFTKKKKGLRASLAPEAAKYSITLHIANIDRLSYVTVLWSDKALKVDGVIDIVDITSGETVCSITVVEFMPSKGTSKISARITQCFNELGSKTAKLK